MPYISTCYYVKNVKVVYLVLIVLHSQHTLQFVWTSQQCDLSLQSQCGQSPSTALSDQCKVNGPLASYPSTKDVTRPIYSICNEKKWIAVINAKYLVLKQPMSTAISHSTLYGNARHVSMRCFQENVFYPRSLIWYAFSSSSGTLSEDCFPLQC